MDDCRGVDINYCPDCRGVWIDRGDLDRIIDRSGVCIPESEPTEDEEENHKHDRDRHSKGRHWKSILSSLFHSIRVKRGPRAWVAALGQIKISSAPFGTEPLSGKACGLWNPYWTSGCIGNLVKVATGAFMSKPNTKIASRDQEPVGAPAELKPDASAAAPLSEQDVADLAYQRWVARGCPQGRPEEDWFEAEHELQSRARSS
jgi:Zn-finger nucleic acid-binding protein